MNTLSDLCCIQKKLNIIHIYQDCMYSIDWSLSLLLCFMDSEPQFWLYHFIVLCFIANPKFDKGQISKKNQVKITTQQLK